MRKTARSSLALLLLWLAGCGGGDDGTGPAPGPDTAAEYTARGWERFEAADFTGALADFEQAVGLDGALAEPRAGRGWAQLSLAESSAQMLAAAARFSEAVDRDGNAAYIRAGRAAANLGTGGTALAAVDADAEAALAADPAFVFAHRPTFTGESVLVTAASAAAGRGDFDAALAYAERVAASGISPDDPDSWVVDGTTCHRYEAAVLAFVALLGRQGAF